MKMFVGFVLISGVGWLLDMMSYGILTQVFGLSPAFANFLSSMVGVTYVWVVALNRLFDRGEFGRSIYLPVYWGYQAASILGYSGLIAAVAGSAFNGQISQAVGIPTGLVAKIVITGPNLLTNFIFMNILTRFMKPGPQSQPLR